MSIYKILQDYFFLCPNLRMNGREVCIFPITTYMMYCKGLAREVFLLVPAHLRHREFYAYVSKSLSCKRIPSVHFCNEKNEVKKFDYVFSFSCRNIAPNKDWRIPQKQN